MKLRLKVVEIIDDADGADPLWMVDAADTILAAIRAHMTSPEAVERSCIAWVDARAHGLDGRNRAAILAALEEE